MATAGERARAFALAGIVAPLVITVVALALQVLFLADAPSPIAVHWGPDGPDGSGPGWLYPVWTAVLGFGMSGWLWASALHRVRAGVQAWTFRFLAATALGFAVFAGVPMTWLVAFQRGLDDWRDAPDALPALIAGLGAGLIAGVIGYWVQPRHVTDFGAVPAPEPTTGPLEWTGRASASRRLIAGMVTIDVVMFALAVFLILTKQSAAGWIVAGSAVLIGLATAMMLEADVTVNEGGVSVRGPARVPHIRIPLENIAAASVMDVQGFAQFGGFGWRFIPGAQGVILRSGEALSIERIEGNRLVVTIDGAAQAAAVLARLLQRRADAAAPC